MEAVRAVVEKSPRLSKAWFIFKLTYVLQNSTVGQNRAAIYDPRPEQTEHDAPGYPACIHFCRLTMMMSDHQESCRFSFFNNKYYYLPN